MLRDVLRLEGEDFVFDRRGGEEPFAGVGDTAEGFAGPVERAQMAAGEFAEADEGGCGEVGVGDVDDEFGEESGDGGVLEIAGAFRIGERGVRGEDAEGEADVGGGEFVDTRRERAEDFVGREDVRVRIGGGCFDEGKGCELTGALDTDDEIGVLRRLDVRCERRGLRRRK